MKNRGQGGTASTGKHMGGISITSLIIGLTVSSLCGCVYYDNASANGSSPAGGGQVAATTPAPPTPAPTGPSLRDDPPREPRAPVTLDAVNLYGRWWSVDQLDRGFDADNAPPKEAYIRLDEWNASESDSPHPERVDIAFRLENNTDQPLNLYVEAFADFKVASYGEVAPGTATQEALDEKLKTVRWSARRKVGRLVMDTLQPGESREARFQDFNLGSVVQKYFEPAAGDLWPWKLRISLAAKDSRGVTVASAEKMINLIPGD